MPGNFAEIYASQLAALHHIPYRVAYERAAALLGLGQPLYLQFLTYLHEILFSFPPNFGDSFEFYPIPAWTIVFLALRWTLLLLGTAIAVSWTLGLFIGIFLATHKNRAIDRAAQPSFYFLNSIPQFWLGILFIILFAIDLHILPATQAQSISASPPDVIAHMILPLSVIVITTAPAYALIVRSAAVDVLGSDFLYATKAQGLKNRRLLLRIMRNSLLPLVTNVALSMGNLIGGVITVELVFAYPGLGSLIQSAVVTEDYPIMLAVFYVTVVVVLVSNLAADLIYPILDPRVSYVSA
jgi:peptide/nickel transport system permease protein